MATPYPYSSHYVSETPYAYPSHQARTDSPAQMATSSWPPLMYGLGIPVTLTLLAWALPSHYHWPVDGSSRWFPRRIRSSSSSSSSSPHPLVLGLLAPLGALSFLVVLVGSWVSWMARLTWAYGVRALRPLWELHRLRQAWTAMGLWIHRSVPLILEWVRYPGYLARQTAPWIQWAMEVGGYVLLLLLHHIILPIGSMVRSSLGSWFLAWCTLKACLAWCHTAVIGLAIRILLVLNFLSRAHQWLPSPSALYMAWGRDLVASWVFWGWRPPGRPERLGRHGILGLEDFALYRWSSLGHGWKRHDLHDSLLPKIPIPGDPCLHVHAKVLGRPNPSEYDESLAP
ncbi:hypothetical protein BJ684DRAFT_14733, partial [Piptocephalis cylindrospora]